jgi:hypothetical protein
LRPATPSPRALARQGPEHEGLSTIRKLRRISELRESDLAVLRSIAIQEEEFPASHDLVLEGERPSHSFVLIDGLVGSTTSGARVHAVDWPDLVPQGISTPPAPEDHEVS